MVTPQLCNCGSSQQTRKLNAPHSVATMDLAAYATGPRTTAGRSKNCQVCELQNQSRFKSSLMHHCWLATIVLGWNTLKLYWRGWAYWRWLPCIHTICSNCRADDPVFRIMAAFRSVQHFLCINNVGRRSIIADANLQGDVTFEIAICPSIWSTMPSFSTST